MFKKILLCLMLAVFAINLFGTSIYADVFDDEYVSDWAASIGSTYDDSCNSIIAVSDGYVLVGSSKGSVDEDWSNNGGSDGIIVKYDLNGNIVWKHNTGGTRDDEYNSIVAVSDGYVVVGESRSTIDENWSNNGSADAIIVKYNLDGTIAWQYNAGGDSWEAYESIIAVSDGYIVAGSSRSTVDESWSNNGGSDGIVTSGIAVDIDTFNIDGAIAKFSNVGTEEDPVIPTEGSITSETTEDVSPETSDINLIAVILVEACVFAVISVMLYKSKKEE